jgi:hypothetical protein
MSFVTGETMVYLPGLGQTQLETSIAFTPELLASLAGEGRVLADFFPGSERVA